MNDTAIPITVHPLRLAKPDDGLLAPRHDHVCHEFSPFSDDGPPEIPAAMVPESIRELVVGKSRELEVPMVMPLAVALGVASAVIQSRWSVMVSDGWTEPTSLFLLVAADPGELKTPTMRPILAPLIDYERSERQRADDANKANATEADIIVERVKQLRRKAAKADDAGERVELIGQIESLDAEIPPVANPTRILADDTTPERLARLMGENRGAMAVITDEGGAFLNRLAGHYSNGSPNIDAVLKAYDNGPLRIDRTNGCDVHLNTARLAVCLMVQKSVARAALTHTEFMGRGLIHRFITLLPGSSRIGQRKFDAPVVSPHVTDRWASLVKSLLSWSPAGVDVWGTTTHHIKLSKPASERFWRYHATLERQAGELDEEDPRRTYRLKWAGTVARLAGVMHCLDVCDSGDGCPPHARVMNEDTMRHAIGLASLMLDHADAAMGMLGQDKLLERARRVLARLEAMDGEITHADLWKRMRNARSLFDSHEQFNDACSQLIRRGYIAFRSKGKSEYYVLSQAALERSPGANRAHRAHAL